MKRNLEDLRFKPNRYSRNMLYWVFSFLQVFLRYEEWNLIITSVQCPGMSNGKQLSIEFYS